MAASALPTALRSITATKIVEVKKQRREFEDEKTNIEESVKRQKTSHNQAVALVKGVAKLDKVYLLDRDAYLDEQGLISVTTRDGNKLRNQFRLLHQSLIDPAFPKPRIEDIRQDITRDLQLRSVQRAHAQFFSELVTEWISGDGETQPRSTSGSDSSSFENVGRKEMHEQRKEWESIVFGKKEVDAAAIATYLTNIFTSQFRIKKAYEDLHKATRQFSVDFAGQIHFDTATLQTQIKGVLATDLLNDKKRAILKTFSSNQEVLQEVCDVLNMRFRSLASWDWTTENGAINVEQRRQLNGKYRVYMDEDVLDTILVHYVGINWSVHFRRVFKNFFNSHAWSSQRTEIPLVDRQRREFFLGQSRISSGIQHARNNTYLQDYFMTQLPETIETGPRNVYDDDGDDGRGRSTQKHPLEIKHGLLHLLVTEAMVARHLNPDIQHTVIRSDFRWFGPSLPHQSIFSIMDFFGVSDLWLGFFRKFLHAPMRFVQDGPEGEIHNRATGIPMSHSLADTMSEVVLFVMDFAVNTSTKTNLYRLHDDFWFWGPLGTCRTAWQQMTIFAKTMGIEFNEEKTGSAVFSAQNSMPDPTTDSEDNVAAPAAVPGLPSGDVRWGFLTLDTQSGRFKINQTDVDKHIAEVKLQLNATTSIFGYIQAYNAYVSRFFSNNFGKPSFAFGREHVDEMISTLSRIHSALFPNSRVVDHLSSVAEERFKVPASSIPDGFWYFPVANGGMELRNPVVQLLNMRESFTVSPARILEEAWNRDVQAYHSAKLHYDNDSIYSNLRGRDNQALRTALGFSGNEPFMSREEYLKHRDQLSVNLLNAYDELLRVPAEIPMESTDEIHTMLATAGSSRPISTGNWGGMNAYWKWVVAVYGKDIMEKFGSLQMVEPAQVPLGVVSVMKASKVKWLG